MPSFLHTISQGLVGCVEVVDRVCSLVNSVIPFAFFVPNLNSGFLKKTVFETCYIRLDREGCNFLACVAVRFDQNTVNLEIASQFAEYLAL